MPERLVYMEDIVAAQYIMRFMVGYKNCVQTGGGTK